MFRVVRYASLPALAALAAFFGVLPHRGGDATVRTVRVAESWRFAPAQIRIDPRERVAFVNDSNVTHTATCVLENCWDAGNVQPGQTKLVSIDREGSYEYVCRYHGQTDAMAGVVIVGDAPPERSEPSPEATEGAPVVPNSFPSR